MEDDVRAQCLKHWEEQDAIVIERRKEAYDIGGDRQIARLMKQGKKTMRDLVRMLIDPGTDFFELGLEAGYNIGDIKLYGGEVYASENRSHIPGGGVVTGIGVIQGKDCMIFANENRLAAGSYFPITLKKHVRAQAIAERLGLPCIYIAASAIHISSVSTPITASCRFESMATGRFTMPISVGTSTRP